MWHLCSALKAESAWTDACAKSLAFHIKHSRKEPKPILQTLVDGKVIEESQLQHGVLLLLLPHHFGLVSERKNIKVIICTSLFLREKLYLIP